jgi:hypothetical protein
LQEAALAELLRVIEQHVHEVAADESTDERPARRFLDGPRRESSPHGLPNEEPAREEDARGGQDSERLQRKWTQAQRRDDEPRDHLSPTAFVTERFKLEA